MVVGRAELCKSRARVALSRLRQLKARQYRACLMGTLRVDRLNRSG
jgi:hypothetical protein